ncbi:YciI family protein [Litorimonas sp. RW-G-Af-16]|uniref:YciI family protein n=1 Tax=Litorimonas sp. RW-G-Af-16 TaxID=3241168 RepID=UPI00390C8714
MSEFIVYTEDKPDSLHVRQAARDAHLSWIKAPSDVTLLVAGPWLDDQGDMRGSLLIVDAADITTVQNWLADDPYLAAGLPASVMIKPYKWLLGQSTK